VYDRLIYEFFYRPTVTLLTMTVSLRYCQPSFIRLLLTFRPRLAMSTLLMDQGGDTYQEGTTNKTIRWTETRGLAISPTSTTACSPRNWAAN